MESSPNPTARFSIKEWVIPAPAPCAKTIIDFVSFGMNVSRDTLPMLSDTKTWDGLDFIHRKYKSKNKSAVVFPFLKRLNSKPYHPAFRLLGGKV